LLVPKLLLGNGVFEAPASQRKAKPEFGNSQTNNINLTRLV